MVQVNRRQFLYSGVAVSAAVALGSHMAGISSEALCGAGNDVLQEDRAAPDKQLFHGAGKDLFTWRQEGLNLTGGVSHFRQYPGDLTTWRSA